MNFITTHEYARTLYQNEIIYSEHNKLHVGTTRTCRVRLYIKIIHVYRNKKIIRLKVQDLKCTIRIWAAMWINAARSNFTYLSQKVISSVSSCLGSWVDLGQVESLHLRWKTSRKIDGMRPVISEFIQEEMILSWLSLVFFMIIWWIETFLTDSYRGHYACSKSKPFVKYFDENHAPNIFLFFL